MRSYERSATGKAQRPIFSAYLGKRSNITGREDQRLFGEHSEANQKIKRDKQLRQSLNRKNLKNVLTDSPGKPIPSPSPMNLYSDSFGVQKKLDR